MFWEWAVEHGHIIGHRPDLAEYNKRLVVFLGDYYQITEQWQRGIDVYDSILAGKFGKLNSAQKDYVHFAIATCLAWQDKPTKSRKHLELVLKTNDHTDAERRAALSLGTVLLSAKDADAQRRGVRMLRALSHSGHDVYAHRAQFNLAQAMLAHGQRARAIHLLQQMPDSAGSLKTLANWLIKETKNHG